jgi:hypothetical protein
MSFPWILQAPSMPQPCHFVSNQQISVRPWSLCKVHWSVFSSCCHGVDSSVSLAARHVRAVNATSILNCALVNTSSTYDNAPVPRYVDMDVCVETGGRHVERERGLERAELTIDTIGLARRGLCALGRLAALECTSESEVDLQCTIILNASYPHSLPWQLNLVDNAILSIQTGKPRAQIQVTSAPLPLSLFEEVGPHRTLVAGPLQNAFPPSRVCDVCVFVVLAVFADGGVRQCAPGCTMPPEPLQDSIVGGLQKGDLFCFTVPIALSLYVAFVSFNVGEVSKRSHVCSWAEPFPLRTNSCCCTHLAL